MAALNRSPLRVHYQNHSPTFVHASRVEREVEVSHWGAASVEEVYEVVHRGAALKEGFARIDYTVRCYAAVRCSAVLNVGS